METTAAKPPARMTDAEQIRKIHALAGRLGLNDLCYRSMLWDLYKVRSSKELTYSRRENLINRLVFQIRQAHTESNGASDKQINLILYLGTRYCNNLNGFLTKVVRREVRGPKDLTMAEAGKAIDALKRYER